MKYGFKKLPLTGAILLYVLSLNAGVRAFDGNHLEIPDNVTETYEISFGPLLEAFPGEQNLFVPIRINVTQPTIGINILLNYDPTLLTPTVVAPNMFFQNFDTDLSLPGRIGINLYTNLPPPPAIPPILGDTIFAWIACRVTTEDIGYDLLTHFTFYEDPVTPYPDNSVLLESGNWIVHPTLALVQGDVLIISPLYGDINVNGFAYEIGDAITFLNYFMGQVQFTRRQYANSDCNRDGVQASISDLVYLLGVISGDTIMAYEPELPGVNSAVPSKYDSGDAISELDAGSLFDVNIECAEALGGAYFVIQLDREIRNIRSVKLNRSVENLNLSWALDGRDLMVAIFDWNGNGSSFRKGDLIEVSVDGGDFVDDESMKIIRAEFSNCFGGQIEAGCRIVKNDKAGISNPQIPDISVSGYPNPFNGAVSISYNLPVDGNYDLEVFDILGRKVKSLITGYNSSGGGAIVWDGTDDSNSGLASGVYFARLRGEDVSVTVKLFMMK